MFFNWMSTLDLLIGQQISGITHLALPLFHAEDQWELQRWLKRRFLDILFLISVELNNVYNRQCMFINILPFGILHIHSRFSLQCAGKTVLFTLNAPQFLESSSTYLSSKNEDTTWKQNIYSLSLTTQDEAFKNIIMEKGFRHVCTIRKSKKQLEDHLNYDSKIQIGSIAMFFHCPG